jgi:hypothetical protein
MSMSLLLLLPPSLRLKSSTTKQWPFLPPWDPFSQIGCLYYKKMKLVAHVHLAADTYHLLNINQSLFGR